VSEQDPEPHEAGTRRQLASRDTNELVDLWERPMPASLRALLRAELERRSYRTRSLPNPPPDDETAELLPPPVVEEYGKANLAAWSLVLIGLVYLASAAYAIWRFRSDATFGAAARQALRAGAELPLLRFLGATVVFPALSGAAFLAVVRRARRRMHPALTIGFALALAVLAIELALEAAFQLRFEELWLMLRITALALLLMSTIGFGAASSRRVWRELNERERTADAG